MERLFIGGMLHLEMIIGITNLPCSGAGAFARFLAEKGFEEMSYSGLLREELRKRGVEITREAMQNLGNEIREKHGAGELSKRLIAKMKKDRNYVLTTIRNPAEVEELRKRKDFFLVHLDVPREMRYRWMVARGRERDPISYGEFIEMDKKELGFGQKAHGLQIQACFDIADFKIVNDSSIEELKKKVDELLARIGKT